MAAPTIAHPDVVAGALSELLQWVAHPVSNTLADLGVYAGRPIEELFPAPEPLPEVSVTRALAAAGPGQRGSRLPLPARADRAEVPPALPGTTTARRITSTPGASARRRPAGARACSTCTATCSPRPTSRSSRCWRAWRCSSTSRSSRCSPPTTAAALRAARASAASSTGRPTWCAASKRCARRCSTRGRCLSWLLARRCPAGRRRGAEPGRRADPGLTCLEERFAFSIPLIAHMDLAALVADAPVLAKMRRDLRSFGWGRKEFGAFVDSVGWYELRPQAAGGPHPADRRVGGSLLRSARGRRRCGGAGASRRSAGTRPATWASSPTCRRRCASMREFIDRRVAHRTPGLSRRVGGDSRDLTRPDRRPTRSSITRSILENRSRHQDASARRRVGTASGPPRQLLASSVTRNTGKRDAMGSNADSGAFLSTGTCGRAPGALCR